MEDYLQLFVEETNFYNRILLGNVLPNHWWEPLPHYLQTWIRNYIAGTLVYFISGVLWCLYIYKWKRNVYVPKGLAVQVEQLRFRLHLEKQLVWNHALGIEAVKEFGDVKAREGLLGTLFYPSKILSAVDAIPSVKAMILQITVAMKAMPWYVVLPTISEYMVERGWMRCFSRISDVGLPLYLIYLAVYLTIVEFGIYWTHRELHDIKPLYKYLHATHHIYNKQNTLSPFAGLAFHPLDGILQAVPHVIALYVVPTHFTTHIVLLFIEGVWTANIHDCIHGKFWPVMGAGYHTIHHTTYRHNYGHYTIIMDWLFGTLREPVSELSKVK
ncbi:hypothetical protein GIB67_012568 [Kingdonia uniflora]|uniref:Fatty acid hydroxylase domain-containing protein n=1 Tax=Kingdonia uniflora TaxID=39325 RepID=A0A7J7NEM3_9MAGN|nr:hypothetical protein GIB67_012568 [Kingdonia uniflora]